MADNEHASARKPRTLGDFVGGLSLDTALRYFASGAALIVSAALMGEERRAEFYRFLGGGGTWAVVALAFLLGSVLYSAHRACPYRILESWAEWVASKTLEPNEQALTQELGGKHVLRVCQREYDWTTRWWSDAPDGLQPGVRARLGEWAAQIQQLYCTGWALILSIILVLVDGAGFSRAAMGSVCVLAILCFVFAFVSNVRWKTFQAQLAAEAGQGDHGEGPVAPTT